MLALIAAAYIVPGLWHDPWKYWDAIGVGIAQHIVTTGDLLVARVAGVRWMYDPPLFHWVAAACGWLLQFFVEFHAGARVASAAFLAATFAFIHAAGRKSAAEDPAVAGAAALLILLGSVGLMVHAHEALPELAALAALAAGLAAVPQAAQRPVQAGAALGAALGLAFLAAGWTAPTALGAAAAAACLASPQWRTPRGLAFLAVAAALTVLIAGGWLAALILRAPEAFLDWWQLASQRPVAPLANLRRDLTTLSWFAWPAWPLALWAAWSLRRRWREPALLVPALSATFFILLQAQWGHAQQENLIPLLAPLALLGAHGVFTLRRGAVGAFDWFGVLTFGFFTVMVWLAYLALLTGFPARLAAELLRLAPGHAPRFALLPLLVALALAAGWLYLVFFTGASPMRSVLRWAAGVALLWGTFAMLGLPWADHQKSYRSVALQLRSKIPVGSECVAQRGLGMPQAAALDYHAGIRTQPFDLLKPTACPLILVQGNPKHELDAPASGGRWAKLADVGRPGDRVERYRLYRLSK